MDYIYGSALLLASMLALASFRAIFARRAANKDTDDFGGGELIALAVTATAAFSIALMTGAILRDWSVAGFIELAIALGVAIVASAFGSRMVARFFHPAAAEAGAPVNPTRPVTPRPGHASDAANRNRAGRTPAKRAA